jgi:hypothetical protein
MRNGEGGTVPSYNVQLLTDVTHGLVVNVDATTDAIDYRQMQPGLERCGNTLGQKPKLIARRRLHQSRVGAVGRSLRGGLLWIVAR